MFIGWTGLVAFILFRVISPLLSLYFWIIIISAVLSWVQPDPYHPLVRAIYGLTEPVFEWIREHMPVVFGGIDLSPMVLLLVVEFLQVWLLPNLYMLLLNLA
ncbi:MAG: YggT family protein [Candidatus Binataceae bacterium]|nr:YggT family protein [Candidatus Binataceae bacterium]